MPAPGAAGGGGFDALWLKLQQQHAQEASAGEQPAPAAGLPQAAQQPLGAGMQSETEAAFWRQLQGQR
jgi:hypothetical protein